MRAAVDHLFREGRLLWWGVAATGVLVETLLDRGTDDDVPKPRRRSTGWRPRRPRTDWRSAKSWLLRPRALLARARGDDVAYRDFRDRYRAMAKSLGFEGHIDWAEAMIEDAE